MAEQCKKAMMRCLVTGASLLVVLGLSLLNLVGSAHAGQRPTCPPHTRVDNVREVIHGVEIVDPYRWLEDQEASETRAWIDAQNQYSYSLLGALPVLPSTRKRLTELMKVDQYRAPIERAGRYFFWKKRAQDDLWILCLRRGLTADDEVLIDPHRLSEDHTTTASLSDVSRDGKLLAYGVRRGGTDEVEIRVMNVDTRADLPDRLPTGLYWNLAFTRDNKGFYYSFRDRAKGERIYFHALGSDPAEDREVFGSGYGPDKWVSAQVSEDGRYLLLTVAHGWTRTEVYVQDLVKQGPIQTIVNDLDAAFEPAFADDFLFMQTNWEAPKGRIIRVDLNKPARDKWREIIPTAEEPIRDSSLVGGRLFVHYLRNATSEVKVFTPEGKQISTLELPGRGTATVPRGNWESAIAFFTFQSYTAPPAIYRYEVASGKVDPWARDAVPFDPRGFEMHQVWYTSKDGTRVPMFVVHKKGLKLDGKRPTLLHGYGGFDVSLTPRFQAATTLWLERGGVFAVANLRGGGEFGEEWHRAGMLENKQNVFDDFVAAAEWLIKNRYAQPSTLAITGTSNGGLLVGAALTQRPDLFQAVLCRFPDLDMVRYYQFKGNNAPALLEYGNAADPEQFKFLYAYSPYHRVKHGTEYPAVLLTTGDADTRVPPLQARKMCARLQSATTSDRPVLLLYDTKAGHSGGKPLSKLIEDTALEMAFLFWQLGME